MTEARYDPDALKAQLRCLVKVLAGRLGLPDARAREGALLLVKRFLRRGR
jgi:hypothetical protein